MKRRGTSLFDWSLTLGMWSNVGPSVLTASWSPLVKLSQGIQEAALFILVILPAVLGIVLGAMSWKRKEQKPGWIITVIALNIFGLLVGMLFLIL
jgi:uncharacterized membrane protein HdeD (DUF308 family)